MKTVSKFISLLILTALVALGRVTSAQADPNFSVTNVVRYAPSGQYTNASSVQFKVTFSEPVKYTTVGVDDFVSNMITGAMILSVAPDPVDTDSAEYFVTVGSYTDEGTVNLVVQSGGIDNLNNEPLTNGYGAGEFYIFDTTPPVVTSPSNQIAEATDASGAMVSYSGESATDEADPPNPSVACLPSSGSTFALGDTTVTCSATDTAGNTGEADFTVTVQDTTSPSASLDIPIVDIQASENVGVTGYMITESPTQPGPGDGGWLGTKPAAYHVPSGGDYTLYPWVKDAAGNVSAVYGSPASVTVTVDHTVTFGANGGSGSMSPQTASAPTALTVNAFTRTGYTFAGWDTVALGGGTHYNDGASYDFSADVTLYAQWTANTYTVTFNSSGFGAPNPTSKMVTYGNPYGALANITRTGYTLHGWYTAASYGVKVTALTTVTSTANHTLYAYWTAKTYTVTFDSNGGDTPNPASKMVTYDRPYGGPLATVARTGYTFSGWYTAASGGVKVIASTTVTATANHTLYAHWIASPVTITFQSIGSQDGYVLESTENSSVGGSHNFSATTLRLGDDTANRQNLSILSFNTGVSLPDNIVITAVTLKIKQQTIINGGNPVSIFQGFMVDIKNGFFGSGANLQLPDFQAAASQSYGPFLPAPVGGWYSINLTGGKANINKLATNLGLTQVRLRFKLDDNNNAIANYLSLYSGDASAEDRPQLVITYHLP